MQREWMGIAPILTTFFWQKTMVLTLFFIRNYIRTSLVLSNSLSCNDL